MVFTMRDPSGATERIQISVVDKDGSKRVATLERDARNARKWTGSVDHPSGEKFPVEFTDPSTEPSTALGGLAQAFVSREVDYRNSRARGHKVQNRMLPDHSLSIEDSPIVPYTSHKERF